MCCVFEKRLITFKGKYKIILTEIMIWFIFDDIQELFIVIDEFLLKFASSRKCSFCYLCKKLGFVLFVVFTWTVQKCGFDCYLVFTFFRWSFFLELSDIRTNNCKSLEHILSINILFFIEALYCHIINKT